MCILSWKQVPVFLALDQFLLIIYYIMIYWSEGQMYQLKWMLSLMFLKSVSVLCDALPKFRNTCIYVLITIRTSVTCSPNGSNGLFFVLTPFFMSSVIYYWTNTEQHGISLLGCFWELIHNYYLFIKGFSVKHFRRWWFLSRSMDIHASGLFKE